jgi:hypothetical protein
MSTRRDFLKQLSAAAAGLAVIGPAALAMEGTIQVTIGDKFAEYASNFDNVIWDEQHHLTAEEFKQVVDGFTEVGKFNVTKFIGTPHDSISPFADWYEKAAANPEAIANQMQVITGRNHDTREHVVILTENSQAVFVGRCHCSETTWPECYSRREGCLPRVVARREAVQAW